MTAYLNAGNRTELIVDNRVNLAIGGTAVVAASAAILLSAAIANAADLADVAGAPIGASAVVVPSSQAAAATSSSTPRTDTTPPQVAPDAPTGAITVPAPDPFVVTGGEASSVAETNTTSDTSTKANSKGSANGNGTSSAPQTPAHAGNESGPAGNPHGAGLKRGQSQDSPDR